MRERSRLRERLVESGLRVATCVGGPRHAFRQPRNAHEHALAHAHTSREPRTGLLGDPEFPETLWLRRPVFGPTLVVHRAHGRGRAPVRQHAGQLGQGLLQRRGLIGRALQKGFQLVGSACQHAGAI